MRALKYKTHICTDLIHGWYNNINEIWIDQGEESFCVNETENYFYCQSPRNVINEEIDLDARDIAKLRLTLESKLAAKHIILNLFKE